MKYKVTIFVLTYNHEKFIAECIDGLLNQKTKYSYNILISDDCSTDETQRILKEYKKKYPEKIELILHNKNLGARKNFMEGIYSIKNSEYIATMDGDDIIYEDKIELQVSYMDKKADIVVSYHNMKKVNEDRRESLGYFNSQKQNKISDIKDLALNGNFVNNSSKMIRVSALPKKIKYKEWMRNLDFIFLVQVVKNKKIGYIENILGEYRIHLSGISSHYGNQFYNFYLGGLFVTYMSKKYISKEDFMKAKNRVYFTYAFRAYLENNYICFFSIYKKVKILSLYDITKYIHLMLMLIRMRLRNG